MMGYFVPIEERGVDGDEPAGSRGRRWRSMIWWDLECGLERCAAFPTRRSEREVDPQLSRGEPPGHSPLRQVTNEGLDHRGGWTLEQPEPGVFIWTSPASRTYRVDTNTNEEEGLLPAEDRKSETIIQTAMSATACEAKSERQPPEEDLCPF
jgi:hypothetical protein